MVIELGLCIYEVDDLLFYIGFRGLYPGGDADACGWFYPYASELLFTARLQNDTFGEYSAPIIYTYLVTPVCCATVLFCADYLRRSTILLSPLHSAYLGCRSL